MPEDCISSCACCPRVHSCCCCSLETGASIIGFILLVVGFANIIYRAFNLKDGHYLTAFDFSISIIMVITGILLRFGIFQDAQEFVKSTLLLLLLMIGLYCVLIILATIELALLNKFDMYVFGFIINGVLMAPLLFYFFVVLLSFYDQ